MQSVLSGINDWLFKLAPVDVYITLNVDLCKFEHVGTWLMSIGVMNRSDSQGWHEYRTKVLEYEYLGIHE